MSLGIAEKYGSPLYISKRSRARRCCKGSMFKAIDNACDSLAMLVEFRIPGGVVTVMKRPF